MKSNLVTPLILVTLICACSTISKNQSIDFPLPPTLPKDTASRGPLERDLALENQYRSHPDEPTRLLVRYRQAKLWSEIDTLKSCAIWNDIAKEADFPLRELVRLRQVSNCTTANQISPSDIDDLLVKREQFPWMSELILRTAHKIAIDATKLLTDNSEVKSQFLRREMELSLALVDFDRIQSDKIAKLQRSLQIADQLSETDTQNSMREKIKSKLSEVAPRFIPFTEANPSQLLSIAMDYRFAREFTKARTVYRQAISSNELTALEKLKALNGIRFTYKLERDDDKYIKATRAYSKFARQKFYRPEKSSKRRITKRPIDSETESDLEHYFNAQITLARTLWTKDNPKAALRTLEKLEREINGRISVAESILIRARINEEAEKFARAAWILGRIDLNSLKDLNLKQKILWLRFWNLKKIGRPQEGIAFLQQLLPIEESNSLLTRDHFWLARTYLQLNQKELAQQEFQWLIENDPMGYYGLLAYRELNRPLPSLTTSDTRGTSRQPSNQSGADESTINDTIQSPLYISKTLTEKDLSSPDLSIQGNDRLTIEWLLAVDEKDLARTLLDQVSANQRSQYNDQQAIDLLQLYARSGHYLTLFTRLYEIPAKARDQVIRSHPNLVFPQPWPQLVADAAKKFEVPIELIYSIIRQESSFNPLARSSADAFGLMQLIPSSADRASVRAGFKLDSHLELFDPEKNIPLGTAFIRELLDQWKSQFVLAVASYNANEKAIAGWVKTRFHGDPLAFIEDIPYEETRNYIKLVVRNYVFYSRLNSGESEIHFPEWCLDHLQDFKL